MIARLTLLGTALTLALATIGGCKPQPQASETAPTLPGDDDEERQASRFGEPGAAATEADRIAPPSTEGADAAPGGSVEGLDGKPVNLADLYATKNLVVVFYRGGWCRFCRRQLGELQEHYKELLRAGAEVCAISTESADLGADLVRKLSLEYPLLVDHQGGVARKWGVLNEENGIAKLSTFIVERGGAIVFRHVAKASADYPATADVISAVGRIPESE
jgi:peroxiredoxin